MSYIAPLKDMLFDIEHLANIAQVAELPGFEEAGLDTAQAVLEECAKLTEGVVAPLNWEGDKTRRPSPMAWSATSFSSFPNSRSQRMERASPPFSGRVIYWVR